MVAELDKYDMIIDAVANFYGIDRERIMSHDRSLSVVSARQVAMYIARTHKSVPLLAIAEAFGKTFATVLHHVQAIKRRLETEPELRKEIEEIILSIQGLEPQALQV